MKSNNIRNNSKSDENECTVVKGRNKSHFCYFAQQNLQNKAVEALMKVADNPLAMKMYLLIVQKMDECNALIADYSFFAEYFNVSVATVKRAVKVLKECEVMQVKKMGKNTYSVYILNPEIVWKTNSENLQYCEFMAKVLMAKKKWRDEDEE